MAAPFAAGVTRVDAQQAAPSAGVGDQPRTDTPLVENGAVRDAALVGDDLVVIVGSFVGIKNTVPGNAFFMPQDRVAAYRASTGELVTTFRPDVDGTVLEVEPTPDGTAVLIGGDFDTVDGVATPGVAKLRLDGTLDPTFRGGVTGVVDGLAVDDEHVYVGGSFTAVGSTRRGSLAALDLATGAPDPAFDLPVTEPRGDSQSIPRVRALDLSPDGRTLLVVHQGLRVGGLDRAGVALVDLAGTTATVAPWTTTMYRDEHPRCAGGFLSLRDGAFAPDGTWFATVGRGDDVPPACNTAVRFERAREADGVNDPTWVTRLHDSVYSVEVSPHAVFVGGHFFSVEAPGHGGPEPWWPGDSDTRYGCDTGTCAHQSLAPESVLRGQVAALDPLDGKALPWNPTSSAFEAVFALTWTPLGLLVGHDDVRLGDEDVGRHGLFPALDPPGGEQPDEDPPPEAGPPAGPSRAVAPSRRSTRAPRSAVVRRPWASLR